MFIGKIIFSRSLFVDKINHKSAFHCFYLQFKVKADLFQKGQYLTFNENFRRRLMIKSTLNHKKYFLEKKQSSRKKSLIL